ncbi:MAG: cytochrome c biogenesis protein CcsA [Gammaproteobacteria bacterium]
MIILIVLHIAAGACYALARRRTNFFLPAIFLHFAALAADMHWMPRFDVGISASAFMLMTALAATRKIRREPSRAILLALAAAGMFAPLLFAADVPPPPLRALPHILPAMLAYSFSLLAMLQFLDLWRAERDRRLLRETSAPPLLTLEAECFRTLAVAFALLSAALLSGFIVGGDPPAHKLLFAVLSWLTFGGLLAGRRLRGWRGRAARRWLAAGLLFFLLSYFGTHFVLQVLLGRAS